MRVAVDPNVCEGHGQCFAVAEEVYALDGDGYSFVRPETSVEVPPVLAERARDGAAACPIQAITVHE